MQVRELSALNLIISGISQSRKPNNFSISQVFTNWYSKPNKIWQTGLSFPDVDGSNFYCGSFQHQQPTNNHQNQILVKKEPCSNNRLTWKNENPRNVSGHDEGPESSKSSSCQGLRDPHNQSANLCSNIQIYTNHNSNVKFVLMALD